ncbi:MAG TPA: tetratricopeptide repeat protein [Gemmatimonadales bacterium]|nr:tetratricopeptide repeat protein [Gemmatimonadales bacterium]
MKTRYVPAGLALVMAAMPLGAASAQQQGNARVIEAMSKQGGAGAPAACKAGFATGGKVGDALADLKDASGQKDAAKRDKLLREAQQKLVGEAQKSPTNAGAWLYLGRAYLYAGDIAGADSAFTNAEKLAPDCKEDIQRYRQAAWVPLVNDGVDFSKAEKNDSALALFRDANTIYRGQPNGLIGAGVIFANRNESDSAIKYLKAAADAAAAANLPEDRNNAMLNLGIIQARAKKFDDAIATLEQYRTWAPKDTAAVKTLVYAYRNSGQKDKADALAKEFNMAPTEVAGGDTKDEANRGVALFQDKKYAEAAQVFGEVFAKQPFNHDALLNQAQSYYNLKDGAKLVDAASKFTALEPMHDLGLLLLEQGYRMQKQTDKQLAVVGQRRKLTTKIETTGIGISPTDIKLTMAATGRQAKDEKDKPIPASGATLVFEFLGSDGAVLATQEVSIPPLAPDANHTFEVAAKANGINGWRYKAK